MRGEIRRRDEDAAHPTVRCEPLSFQTTVFPAWLFWVVACGFALLAGVGVAYFGSPESGTPLETAAPASSPRSASKATPEGGSPTASGSESTTGSGTKSGSGGSDGPKGSRGSDGGRSGFAGDVWSEFDGTPIQVLNATTREGSADRMASRLAREGFTIQVVETARRIYRRTTVFWTPDEGRRAALALANRFGWQAAPKPATLTDEIPVHVVVGEDEVAAEDEVAGEDATS